MARHVAEFIQTLKRIFWAAIQYIVGAVQATWFPYEFQVSPLRHIAEAPSEEQDSLTKDWLNMKLAELNMVAIASALISSVVTSALSWTEPTPWPATAFWLCALQHSLFAMVVAAQQSVALTRASCAPDGLGKIRTLMGAATHLPDSASPHCQPHSASRFQVGRMRLFVWQVLTMMLGTSVMLLLFGLMVYVYSAASNASRWGPEVKTALWFSISFAFGGISYLVSWDCTEQKLQELCLKTQSYATV